MTMCPTLIVKHRLNKDDIINKIEYSINFKEKLKLLASQQRHLFCTVLGKKCWSPLVYSLQLRV